MASTSGIEAGGRPLSLATALARRFMGLGIHHVGRLKRKLWRGSSASARGPWAPPAAEQPDAITAVFGIGACEIADPAANWFRTAATSPCSAELEAEGIPWRR